MTLDALSLARDIPGVIGSYVVDEENRVLQRDLPGGIEDSLLSRVAHRCTAAIQAVSLSLPGTDQLVLRFERLVVVAVRAESNVVLLVAEPAVETSIVRTAMRVVGARARTLSGKDAPTDAPADERTVPPSQKPRRRLSVWE